MFRYVMMGKSNVITPFLQIELFCAPARVLASGNKSPRYRRLQINDTDCYNPVDPARAACFSFCILDDHSPNNWQ
jgi:hypothetical protein